MRLLHTSDWHLGRSLHREDLRDAQAAFVDHLVETVREEQVDAVLVAGDVYDRAVPSLDAVQLCEEALTRLRETGAHVVVISGNHDSARRLGFGSRLLDSSGVFLRTQPTLEPVLLGDVPVYAVPYLDPGPLTDHLREVAAVAPPYAVVMAHGWVAGGAASDSERDITVGGVGAIAPSLLDGFAYSALGHLHGPQVIAEGVRYSGSPLAYSFSEAGHRKGSWLVQTGTTGLQHVEFVPAPVPRRLSSLRGELAQLLLDPALSGQEHDWLTVTLTDAARPEEAMARLRIRFPHVLVLAHEPAGVVRSEETYAARVTGRTDLQVSTAFVEHVRGTVADEAEQVLLAEALESVRPVTQ
ncbi:MAG TPA: exonuclease SbcCD subunit D [Mycobacteriales bacterium]|nr:exonuclease SbcCD subunit D [Mycobacteriales bacterium]